MTFPPSRTPSRFLAPIYARRAPASPAPRRLAGVRGLLAVGAAAVLAACGGNDSSPPADPMAVFHNQQLQWQPCTPDVLSDSDHALLQDAHITLEQFGADLRCTTMRAPLDYAQPGKGELQVAFMRVAARVPAQRQGAILLNPGGPGGDGQVLAPLIAASWRQPSADQPSGALYQKMADGYDLVGFSPRGTGRSTPLVCRSNERQKYVFNETTDRSARNIEAMLHNARLLAQACADNPLTPYIHTEATARDMDLLRHLMGDEKLNYAGASYGTWLGTWYAAMFPQRVGRMVLTGMVDLTASLPMTFLQQPRGYQRILDDVIVPYANRHADVFYTAGTVQDLGSIFATLDPDLQKVTSDVVTGYLGSAKKATQAVLALLAAQRLNTLVQQDSVKNLVAQGAIDPAQQQVLAQLQTLDIVPAAQPGAAYAQLSPRARTIAQNLAQAYFEELRRPTPVVDVQGRDTVAFAVPSNDSALELSQQQWLQNTNYNAQHYPLAGGLFSGWPGLFWAPPTAKAPSFMKLLDAGQIVVLHTEMDGQTPLSGALRSLTFLPSKTALVFIERDHTHAPFVPYGQACVDEPIARYFLQGDALPQRTRCPANALEWDALAAR